MRKYSNASLCLLVLTCLVVTLLGSLSATGSVVLERAAAQSFVQSDTASRSATTPVLVIGGFSIPKITLEVLKGRLEGGGFQTFVTALPKLGIGDIAVSAKAIQDKVEEVETETGSRKVSIVGFSQGGLVARYYIKYLEGRDRVDRYISLGSPHYGTEVASLCIWLTACEQMIVGSAFLDDLNAGTDTPGDAHYTAIATIHDELVIPTNNALLHDEAENTVLQDFCPGRNTGHLGLVFDRAVYDLIEDALKGGSPGTSC